MKNVALRKLLFKRKMDVGALAEQIFTSRSHLTQVFLGQRKGTTTWKKLEKAVELGVMTEAEFRVAKEFADKALANRTKAGQSNGAFEGLGEN
jgi:hypothetical protein